MKKKERMKIRAQMKAATAESVNVIPGIEGTSFTIEAHGVTSEAIPYNATDEQIQAAMDAAYETERRRKAWAEEVAIITRNVQAELRVQFYTGGFNRG